jgi:hypothetical protein
VDDEAFGSSYSSRQLVFLSKASGRAGEAKQTRTEGCATSLSGTHTGHVGAIESGEGPGTHSAGIKMHYFRWWYCALL